MQDNKKEYCPNCDKKVDVKITTIGSEHWLIECAECGELIDED